MPGDAVRDGMFARSGLAWPALRLVWFAFYLVCPALGDKGGILGVCRV